MVEITGSATCDAPHTFCSDRVGYCDKVRNHAGSHVCSSCSETFSITEEELLSEKSNWCLSSCPDCVGKCCRKKGHDGEHTCALDHRW